MHYGEFVMSEAVGFISVHRNDLVSHFFESLYFAEDKVIVLRIAKAGFMKYGLGDVISGWYRARDQDKNLAKLPPEEALKSNENNYFIPFSEITKVELKKFGFGAILTILTNQKEYSWDARGLPDVSKPKFGDYEEVLRRIFSEKLMVKR